MVIEVRAYKKIRSIHRYGYRSGKWARLIQIRRTVVKAGAFRDCYHVEFPDGVVDFWPVDDPSDPYEFLDELEIVGPMVMELIWDDK